MILLKEINPIPQKEYDNMADLDSVISRTESPSLESSNHRIISKTSFEIESAPSLCRVKTRDSDINNDIDSNRNIEDHEVRYLANNSNELNSIINNSSGCKSGSGSGSGSSSNSNSVSRQPISRRLSRALTSSNRLQKSSVADESGLSGNDCHIVGNQKVNAETPTQSPKSKSKKLFNKLFS